jgi:hypothetical protein
MQGLRSIAAIVAGFGFMASTVMVGTIIATALFWPGGSTTTAGQEGIALMPALFVAARLGMGFVAAVMGGWLAARIGDRAPFAHAVALAVLTAVLAVLSAPHAPAETPAGWYPWVVAILGVAGVLLGGKLRAAAAEATGTVIA